MKIQSLNLKNFKNFENRFYVFSNKNYINGQNGVGKTAIAEAIIFALYNQTLFGGKETDNFISKGEENTEVVLNVKDTEIKRIRSKSKSQVFIDGKETSQKNLEKVLELPEFSIFNSIFYSGYFMSLPEKKQRDLILSLTEPVDRKEIYRKAGGNDDDSVDLEDLEKTYKKVNSEKLKFQKLLQKQNVIEEIKDLLCKKCISEIQKNEDKIDVLNSTLDNLQRILKALSIIPLTEIKIKLDEIEEYLPESISINLTEVLKSGMSVRDVFQIEVEGKDYWRLSTGEKKKVDIILSELINNLFKNKINMTFIDNGESLSNEVAINMSQFFFTKVTSEEELKIENL